MHFLIVPPLFVATWIAYSVYQKVLLQDKITAMQVISELRQPDGDPSRVYNWTANWRNTTEEESQQWFLWKEGRDVAGSIPSEEDLVKSQELMVDRKSMAIWGKRPPPPEARKTLRELCALRSRKAYPCEDLLDFIAAQDHCGEALEGPPKNISGRYYYAYRDYPNFEELVGMLNRRFHYQRLRLHLRRVTLLEAFPSEEEATGTHFLKIRMSESYFLYAIIPFRITWTGRVVERRKYGIAGGIQAKIIWEELEIQKGWKWLGQIQRNPPTTMKLYGQPWEIRAPKEDRESGDMVIFYRQGRGKLVFCRSHCIRKG